MFPFSNTWKPVARMSVSTSCSLPSTVRTPEGAIASIGVVSRCTLGRLNVARYSFEKLGRLQPSP
jgi:hypothetical protein